MTNVATDPRLRDIRFRGYLTACRVLGTLALLPLLFQEALEANGQWNVTIRAVCWSVLIATAAIQFWLYRKSRE